MHFRFRLIRAIPIAIATVALSATDVRAQAAITRVSVATDGTAANDASDGASVSADGRYVAFRSFATNLIVKDTNASADIFVRDRQMNATTRVSVTSLGEERAGHSSAPEISASGRYVVFISAAPLVDDDTQACQSAPAPPACEDIYVHDRVTGFTTRASVSSANTQANGDSFEPHISSDGRFVVFESLATNLAPGGAPGVRHAFLRDRQNNTTTRLVGNDTLEQRPGEPEPRISADGSTVLFTGFVSPALLPFTASGAQPTCWHDRACPATFIYSTATGAVGLLSDVFPGVKDGDLLFADEGAWLSANGRHIIIKQVMIASMGSPPPSDARFLFYDRVTGGKFTGPWRSIGHPSDIVGFSGDGRYHVWLRNTDGASNLHARVFHDRVASLDDVVFFAASSGSAGDPIDMSLSFDARLAAFVTRSPLDAADTNFPATDIYVMDRDADGDGMPTGWETRFGLLPADGTDAAGDADGDGVGNLAEYQRGSHPDKGFTRYLAEGAANGFMTTRLALVNPQDTAVDVALRLLGSSGNRVTQFHTLAARSRATVTFAAGGAAPENDFATVIESKLPVVVDRTMTWDSRGYGAHAESSVESPSTTWFLAEGATHGTFDLFYLLLNASGADTTATIKYLRPAPLPPIVKSYTVPANGRKTIWVDAEAPELAETDVSAVITSDQPVVVERAMYSSIGGVPFAAGHEGAGVTAAARTWYLAEGATGNFFDLYLLIANPGLTEVNVAVVYMLPDGSTVTRFHDLAPESRKTITVDDEAPELANTPVSISVGTRGELIVVERAMWWPSPNWYEAHLSAGTTTVGARWALADGEIGSGAGDAGEVKETYILIANTGSQDGSATVTLLVEGSEPVVAPFTLKANSRTNVPVSALFPAGTNAKFGAIIESNGVPIVVERAMYTTAGGVTWTAGTAAVATKLQ